MNISTVKVGAIQTNCYIVSHQGRCIVIDPGDEPERILAEMRGARPSYIVLTHRHWDHVGALPVIAEKTGAPVAVHELDAAGVYGIEETPYLPQELLDAHARAAAEGRRPELLLKDGDTFELGDLSFELIHSPGHTPGSCCLYCAQEKALFAGDTIFAGGRFGRTDFEGGSMEAMVESLQTKFAHVPDDVAVFPGHEQGSSMGAERRLNPYLR